MPTPSFPTVIAAGLPGEGRHIPTPSRPFAEGVKTNTLTVSFDSGHEQRRQKSAPKRTFDLQWLILTYGAYITIRNFYIQVLNVKAFYWTHPIEKTVFLVKFSSDTFAGSNKGHGPGGPTYELSLKLEQVWE